MMRLALALVLPASTAPQSAATSVQAVPAVPVLAPAGRISVTQSGGVTASGAFTKTSGGAIVMVNGEVIAVQGAPGAAPAAGTAAAQAPEPPSPRQQRLQQLEYDRRPSAVLKAWASLDKAPEKAGAQATSGEDADGHAQMALISALGYAGIVVEEGVEEPGEEGGEPAAEAAAAPAPTPEDAAAKAAEEAKALEKEVAALQRDVALGEWGAVRAYFAGISEAEAEAGFEKMLQSLQRGPQQHPQVPHQGQPYLERNRFSPADVLGIAASARAPLQHEQLASLGAILRQAFDQGHQVESFLAGVLPAIEAGEAPFTRRQLALVLVGANEPLALEALVPPAGKAEVENDREGLNLISRYCLARHARDKKVVWLEEAWRATRAVLAAGEVGEKEKAEALERAVDIAPRIRAELGQSWLDESFTDQPERGMEILATIGAAASRALQSAPMDADRRFKLLELQTTAAKALLRAAPELAASWRRELTLLAHNWMREAEVSYQLDDSKSLGPRMQRDNFGNYFYWNSGNVRGNQVSPLATSKVLDVRPGEAWLALLDDTLRPRFHVLCAQLYLKVAEETRAFPHIEAVAGAQPRAAKALVDEFLRVWALNHNPNQQQRRVFVFYGFEERAEGIPLTRSKQERNLVELGEWLARLRALEVTLDDALIAEAFTAAHSAAEVYRLETIERIFGPVQSLEPGLLAQLVGKMRANLLTVWRDPAVQREKRTNRHQKDIEAEVLRGYGLARATVEGAFADHPDSWELCLELAALEHDENEFRRELAKDSEFSSRRQRAFEIFRTAAGLYAARVEALEDEQQSVRVYETWFYAALGACDLRAADHTKQLAAGEIPRIREALLALPGESAASHMARFASSLPTRMGSVSPGSKHRYLEQGLAITGDHELTREAQDLLRHYKDVVAEIQLRVAVEGSPSVGSGAPFGLRVDLRHTREIERESGGFSKYLQNQNNVTGFVYNYGRPTENYREKFEEAARAALKEHFEVLSVTFNDPKARSRAEPEYGWRVTPYAYILLQARGPGVDRIPPLHIDLDFLDTSGYAVLPVASSPVIVDAASRQPRPCEALAVTQILDERQAKGGKLLLEVKASGRGLPPELDELLELAPEGFDLARTEDHGVSVAQFDPEVEGVLCERRWTLTFEARADLPAPPERFTFGTPKVETAGEERYRYADADLVAAERTVALERSYGERKRTWIWALPIALAFAGAVFLGLRRLPRTAPAAEGRFQVPDPLTPFSVIGLLERVGRENGLSEPQHAELREDLSALEQHYFGAPLSREPDLRGIAERWVARAR